MSKKKVIFTILLPLLVITTALVFASAYFSSASEGSDFIITDGVLTKYNGDDSTVNIPAEVTVIGKEAFSNNPFVESVSIPGSVDTIDSSAFSNCVNLREVKIPETLVTIKDSAFSECKKLEKINIGTNTAIIDKGAFASCVSLSSIDIPSGNACFVCDNGVIYTKDRAKIISYLAGNKCVSYKMPSTVNDILDYAFYGTENLKEIFFSASLKKISPYAFYNCKSLEHAVLYEPINEICIGAFDNCSNLAEIHLPISLSNIYKNSFYNCQPNLIFVCDNNSYPYKYAKENGFNTSNVCNYVVVNPIESTSDSDVDSNSTSDNIISENLDDPIYGEPVDNNGSYGSNSDSDDVIISNSTIVSDRAFVSTSGLTVCDGSEFDYDMSSELLGTIKSVPDYDKYNAVNLADFDFSANYPNVNNIGFLSFARSDISSVSIPNNVVTIEFGAFYHCDNLESIVVPDSVVSIEAFAFEHTPWFDNWKNNGTNDFLIVGDGVLYSYKGNSTSVIIPDGVKFIAPNSFTGHNEIVDITFPESLTGIGNNAFYGCHIEQINGLKDTVSVYGESGLDN